MLNFKILYFVSQVFGVSVVLLTVIWVVNYMGLVWDGKDVELYNWHSIFMVLGMIFLYGNCKMRARMKICVRFIPEISE